jgi:hypothetical protein
MGSSCKINVVKLGGRKNHEKTSLKSPESPKPVKSVEKQETIKKIMKSLQSAPTTAIAVAAATKNNNSMKKNQNCDIKNIEKVKNTFSGTWKLRKRKPHNNICIKITVFTIYYGKIF